MAVAYYLRCISCVLEWIGLDWFKRIQSIGFPGTFAAVQRRGGFTACGAVHSITRRGGVSGGHTGAVVVTHMGCGGATLG